MAIVKIVQHPVAVGDNLIMTGKHGEPNKETVLLGAERVVVGVATGNKVIKTNPENGMKYEANEVVAKEIYNVSTQCHHCWFVLDLETGGRGWYPGKPSENEEDGQKTN